MWRVERSWRVRSETSGIEGRGTFEIRIDRFVSHQHRDLLEQAVEDAADWANLLDDTPVVITGASGFLASSLIIFLTRLNDEYGLNLDLHATARRPLSDVPLFSYLGVEYRGEWEIASVEETSLPEIPGSVVVHTASYGSPKDYQQKPIETFEANTVGLTHLYEEARRVAAGRVVYFSSAEIYGQPPSDAIPTPEEFVGGLSTMEARSIYGESKRMAEVMGVCLAESTGIPMTVIRPWNLYGPGQRPADGRVPVEFVRQALEAGSIELLSDGSPTRSFCYVWDGIAQISRLLAQDGAGRAWNVGNGVAEVSVLELARACVKVSGIPEEAVRWNPAARAPGMQRSAPDMSAVLSLSGMSDAFTPLSVGLSTVLEWLEWHKTE